MSRLESVSGDRVIRPCGHDSASGKSSARRRKRKQSEVMSHSFKSTESTRKQREGEFQMKNKLIEDEKSAEGSVSEFL